MFHHFQIKLFCYMNKYEIIDTIGQGQYGLVLKARNKQTSELVAIKKFKEDDSDEETKRVILREVKILKSLDHENIIELKQAFRRKGKIYLVCQYVEKNLLQILEQGAMTVYLQVLQPQKQKSFAFQLLKGIHHMHNLDIIHRDIKPENVLISKNNIVKICDMGFSRKIPSNGVMTDYVATRWYRPPQLLLGKQVYDKSIDIWAAGCVIAQLIDGEPLFGGQNDLDQLYLIQKCLGPLTCDQQEQFLKNPKFVGMKFPEISVIETIQRKYFGKIDKFGIDLLKKMLVMDPSGRITAQQALAHPFFNKLNNEDMSQKISVQGKSPVFQTNSFRSNLPINNFVHQTLKNRQKDERSGINKVTGLSKLHKMTQQQLPQQQIASPWIFNKGKSLTKKPLSKQRVVMGQQKAKNVFQRIQKHLDAEQYQQDEHWQESIKNECLTRNNTKAQQKLIKEQKSRKKRFNFKKQGNINIIFNNNTYNLNVVNDSPTHC